MKIMHVLHKLILNEQDDRRGETGRAFVERNCFILSDYGFTARELSPI